MLQNFRQERATASYEAVAHFVILQVLALGALHIGVHQQMLYAHRHCRGGAEGKDGVIIL